MNSPQGKNITRIVLATALILLIPLVAMQFSETVVWTFSDFVVAGALLLGAGLLFDLAMRKLGKYRVPGAVAVIIFFSWLWVELAVGLFTNWGS